ncbi:MAG: Gfo/Idh/MocA family oxidoreductase [Polyangiaceae bacterium]
MTRRSTAPMEPPLRVLVAGVGAMGMRHVRALGRVTTPCEVVACVDPDPRARASVAVPAKSFEHVAQALDVVRPDAAIVATSTDAHVEVTESLLAAGIPTLVEKPAAEDSARALGLVLASRRTGTPVMVGHVERFNPAVSAARGILDAGMLGRLVAVSTRRLGRTPANVRRAGDVLVDLAIHDLDLVAWLSGATLDVVSAIGAGAPLVSTKALLRAGPVAVDVHVGWNAPEAERVLTLEGDRAVATVDLLRRTCVVRSRPGTRRGSRVAVEVPVAGTDSLERELDTFLRAVRAGAESMPVPLGEALRALATAEAVRNVVVREEVLPDERSRLP